ncbi:MAG: transcription termination/antitermination protein NusG, partial [Candidatus Omnitrophota bacterium]
GYILVEMGLNDKTWYLIKNTMGVTGFVGSKTKPVPLKDAEVTEIMEQTKEVKAKPVPKVVFKAGEAVRIKEGPFKNFSGTIEETNLEKGKIKVMISIFGRATPVELEAWQVEKI